MRIIVAGGSIAGLSSALVLARAGHEIVLVERDHVEVNGTSAPAAFEWRRDGIPHFQQPHALLPRGRLLMLQELPDVYRQLLDAGALEYDCSRIIPGPSQPEDKELIALAVRRPLIEWALRRAIAREPRVEVFEATRITGFAGRPGTIPHIDGVRTARGAEIRGDAVVEALGRTSPAPMWIEELAGMPPAIDSSSCGLIYYSRYFRVGGPLPDGPWLVCFGPRVDLGYAMFSTFTGDNRTFAIVFGIPNRDAELRILKRERAFMAACAEMPALRPWMELTDAEPITPVMPMGALENSIRSYEPGGHLCATGLFPAGDAICHTDPAFGLGLSFALIHAVEIRRALARDPSEPQALVRSYFSRIWPEICERYLSCRDLDNARDQAWNGAKLDFSRPTGCYPMFVAVAGGAVSLQDGEVCRKWLRRATLLDRLSVFDDDLELQRRVESQFAKLLKSGAPRPEQGPDRETLLARVGQA
ncbi:MAG: hypothetical protein JO062_02915 [Bryobacterales bacterium]|nr:hypothetical protein [Bryobacterales bacterium]